MRQWIPIIAALIGIGACDGEVKVDTETRDDDTSTSATTNGGSDTVVTGGGLGEVGDDVRRPSDPPETVFVEPPPKDTVVIPSSRNIRVTSPRPGEVITGDRFTLRGESRTFENTGSYRLRARDRSVLAEGYFTATGEMGTFSPYTTSVALKRRYTGDAVLEVFQFSAKDGSEIDKVVVPLRIRAGDAGAKSSVRVFFTNDAKNPGAIDCSRVFATTREITSTPAVARAAVEQLLIGPTDAERRQSYGTEIPAGTRLRDVRIDNGTATVDFSRELNTGGGSCRVIAARAQIEQTLRQFPSIRRVVVTVEGSSAGVLQP